LAGSIEDGATSIVESLEFAVLVALVRVEFIKNIIHPKLKLSLNSYGPSKINFLGYHLLGKRLNFLGDRRRRLR